MTIKPAIHDNILRAAKALRDGKVVAFPTETVYGLGADATNADAVAQVFEMKGRPRFNPLIVHCDSIETAESHVEFSDLALKLGRAFWPGALSIVLPRKSGSAICDLVSTGLDTVAVRVPQHPIAQELLREAGCPVAAPSANKAGRVSPTTAEHVVHDLGDGPEMILDGSFSAIGLESTVIGLNGDQPALLRPGAIAREDLERLAGQAFANSEVQGQATPASPGQLESHYAPKARVRMNATSVKDEEALLAFGPDAPATNGPFFNLSESGDLREAAVHFFFALRKLDETGCETIAVVPIPEKGLGEAINDRLRRAAAPR